MVILGFDLSPVGIEHERQQEEWGKSEARRYANHRPMCGVCGRFIAKASIKSRRVSWEYAEYDYVGTCIKHGEVDVIWPEM